MKKASSLILFTKDRQSIILQKRDRSEYIYFSGYWGLIGGAAEENETAEECMIRECLEETGWRPKCLRKVLEVDEHCNETVFVSYVSSMDLLNCYEGQSLQEFRLDELAELSISKYHRAIIEKCVDMVLSSEPSRPFRVLFYTKILPPAFGGYVSAGLNLYNSLNRVADVQLVTDDSLCGLNENARFDLLVFNATYEKSNVFSFLSSKCAASWIYEHNTVSESYRAEMNIRFNNASRILVPSKFLKDEIDNKMKTRHIEVDVLPIPVNSDIFSFFPNKMGHCIKFISCCAIKEIRNLEFSLSVLKQILEHGVVCQWDIYGEVPFNGDYSYYNRLTNLIQTHEMGDIVRINKPLVNQGDIANALHKSDFYIDFSRKETYGQAKVEAIFAGTRMIIPDIDNNKHLLGDNYDYYDGCIDEVTDKVLSTIDFCKKNTVEDNRERKLLRERLLNCSLDEVTKKIQQLIYETV